jgi:hypothetical protein
MLTKPQREDLNKYANSEGVDGTLQTRVFNVLLVDELIHVLYEISGTLKRIEQKK